MIRRIKRIKRIKRKGFTLIEAVVSLFVFSILVASISGVYVEFIDAQRYARDLQTRLENLQMQSNLISKTARTSKLTYAGDESGIANTDTFGTVSTVILYDYSRTESGDSKCLRFKVDPSDGILKFTSSAATDETACTWESFGTATEIPLSDSFFKVAGQFYFKHGNDNEAGLFMVSLRGCDKGSVCDANEAKSVRVQAAASMKRD